MNEIIIAIAGTFVVSAVVGWIAFDVAFKRGRTVGYTQGWRDHEAVTAQMPKRGQDGRFKPKAAA